MGTSATIAYVWAIIISLVFFVIAAVISNMILNKAGGKDIKQRRVWFWICFILGVGIGFGVNMYLAMDIRIPTKHAEFMTASGIAAGVAAVIYIVLGVVLSKSMKRSKIGSWF